MSIVLDASVAAAWCFPFEGGNSAAEAVAMQVVSEPGIVPMIFWYEIRNVLVRAERAGQIARDDTERFLGRLDQLEIQLDNEHDETQTLELARRHRLTC